MSWFWPILAIEVALGVAVVGTVAVAAGRVGSLTRNWIYLLGDAAAINIAVAGATWYAPGAEAWRDGLASPTRLGAFVISWLGVIDSIAAAVALLVLSHHGRRDGPRPGEARSKGTSPTRYWLSYAIVLAGGAALVTQWSFGVAVRVPPAAMICALGLLAPIRLYLASDGGPRLLAGLDRFRGPARRATRRDPLTGLPDRGAFFELLAEAMASSERRPLTIAYLRPNRGQVLDSLGTDRADEIILELSARIGARLIPGDQLARVSDATFAVLINGDTDAAIEFVHEVMIGVEAPIRAGDTSTHLVLAAGLATTPMADEPEPLPAALAQRAAIALATVASVRAGVAVFTTDMLKHHESRFQLQQAVTRALREDPANAISVLFEPIVALGSGKPVGVAARAQWRPEDGEAISAGQLAALAREAGLAGRVDQTVVRGAIEGFSDWWRRWPDLCQQLWITISAETLAGYGSDFSDSLRELLAAAELPPKVVVIDSLDGTPCTATNVDTLRRLRELGVRIASGDALMLAEPRPPRETAAGAPPEDGFADYFDVSPVLVRRCVDDLRARRLVQATAEFAMAKSAATAARQVMTIGQHEQLRDLGVTLARGPLYGSPLPFAKARAFLGAAARGDWQTPVRREAQRRRSSQAWQELRQVISRLPIAAFACDVRGSLIMAEGALFSHIGILPEHLGQSLTEILRTDRPRAGRHPLERPLLRALRGAPSVTTIPVKDRWLQVHMCSRRDPDRTITGALGVAIDVTHRIQAEDALRSSERRFREVFSQAPVGMLIIGPDAAIVQANPAIATMLGYLPGDLIAQPVRSLWHTDSYEDANQQFEALRAGVITQYHAERAYLHKDGSTVWARVTVGTLSDSAEPGTVLGVVEDLRHVKQLEVELRHAQKLEAVGMLAAGIAHEINTPIQFISDNTSFLSQAYQQVTRVLDTASRLVPAAGDAAVRELEAVSEEADLEWVLDQIPKATTHSLEGVAQVANIVRAMRNFGHPDQRERSVFDINAAIRDTAIIAHNELKHVAELHLDLAEVPAIFGYPSELNQVILNLFINAAHAIADAGRKPRGNIRAKTWSDADAVYLAVADDGCGMSPETKSRIFEPFFTTKEVGRGTGQGLTIVYGVVVEKHQGNVQVDTALGEGTTFTIRLPLTEEAL